ncbi:hypothetical protein ACKI1I_28675 [Streptomyces turgidiscabies]|uniref:hypothetical protein n=1 Tax=Streptomyces TaxID=1883 RepID=UPI0005CA8C08|nr:MULTISPECIES: hypothetical protein [Streptomyces]MDX3498176.1 hypothetical protein [Streptomyces turgidiscabies]GAQ75149.1 hypothetical protein T45_06930 [Streptomyces turgidiscabies]
MVFAAFLLPPGMLCLVLVLGRYEEWLLGQSAPTRAARHARPRRHLSLLVRTDTPTRAEGSESEHRRVAGAA